MNIKNTRIEVETQSVNPMLNIWLNLKFDYSIEIPVSVSGKLCHENGRILSILTEYELNTDNKYGLTLRTEQEKNSREKSTDSHSVQLSALLTPLAIQSIEDNREKAQNKSAEFYIEFVIKTMTIPASLDNLQNNDLVRLSIERKHSRISIEQSDWVANFSLKLGIGRFLLLELNIPTTGISDFWKDQIELLTANVLEMEEWIRLGEWKKTMETSRHFFDGLNLKNDTPFKDDLKKILSKEQHNDEGINDLFKAIKSLFDFTSKYAHVTDRAGKIKPYPNAKKEDAYFVYTLSIGLLNLINNKIQS